MSETDELLIWTLLLAAVVGIWIAYELSQVIVR